MRHALVLLAACSWADPITHAGTTPLRGGTCLQIVHPSRHRWDLWRGDTDMGGNARDVYARAMVDHPPSVALIERSSTLEKRGAIIGGVGIGTGWLLVMPYVTHVATGEPGTAAAMTGGILALASLITAGTLAWRSDADQGEAVEDYNAWARAHGCP